LSVIEVRDQHQQHGPKSPDLSTPLPAVERGCRRYRGTGSMFQVLVLSELGYTPSSGSWTRNLLPDGWKNGSGGNSQ